MFQVRQTRLLTIIKQHLTEFLRLLIIGSLGGVYMVDVILHITEDSL